MMGQRLTKTMMEPLTVRWANDDPNPTAVRRVKREREETAADAIVRAEARAPPEQRAAMAHLRFLANARRGRAETNGDDDGDGDEAPNPLAYPDTDAQYPDEGEGGVVADARRVATDDADGADARARRGASVEENAAASTGGAGDGAVGETPDAGAETTAPPPAPFAASVSAEELARINAAIGFAARAPGNVDDAAEDDDSTSSTRTITRRSRWRRWGMRGVEDGRGAGVGTSARASSKAFVSEIARSGRARRSSRKRAHFAKTVIEKRDGEDM